MYGYKTNSGKPAAPPRYIEIDIFVFVGREYTEGALFMNPALSNTCNTNINKII